MIHLNIGSNLNSKHGTKFENISIAINQQEIRSLIKNRKFQVHYHKNDLYEISNLVYRVKIFIFLFGTVISLLFVFLLTRLKE